MSSRTELKKKRYDSQIRLWGDHGQSALESAHICLINATALGTEILKSLILPGIGEFTIIDNHRITEEDIGANCFFEIDKCGYSRAQVASEVLLDLNPDVKGSYITKSPGCILRNNPGFFDVFTIVIAVDVVEEELIALSRKLWELDIPLIQCRSIGFVGYMRVQVREHTVIETHPETIVPDLRLDKPFRSLERYMDEIDIHSLPVEKQSQLPYVIYLYKYLEKWKSEHNNDIPITHTEKEEFKTLLKSELKFFRYEKNYKELLKAINYCIQRTKVPNHVNEIMKNPNCLQLTKKSRPFWVMTRALKEFIDNEGNGCLLLRGSVPEMTADSNSYTSLQNLYRAQAKYDAKSVYMRVQRLLRQIEQPETKISEEDVKLYCKHSYHLHVIQGSSIAQEYQNFGVIEVISNYDGLDSLINYYITLRGLDRYLSKYKKYPGEKFEDIEEDASKMKECIFQLLTEWNVLNMSVVRDDYIQEICRYGGCELHTVSAFLGGCVAQEVIKLVTHQCKPLNNAFVYDAITTKTTIFTF